MVRVLLALCLAFGGRSKFENEIATMQYVLLFFTPTVSTLMPLSSG